MLENRTGGRVVEGARLESGYTLIAYRGFESLSVRQNLKALETLVSRAFFMFSVIGTDRGDADTERLTCVAAQ